MTLIITDLSLFVYPCESVKSVARKFRFSLHCAENLNTVFWWNVSPGFKIVFGNLG
jgi:hypothetical protein